MSKRLWAMTATLVAAAVIALVGFRPTASGLSLVLPYAPELMPRSVRAPQFAAAAIRHYGIQALQATGELGVRGQLEPDQEQPNRFHFRGDVVAEVNGSSFAFRTSGAQIMDRVTLTSGKTVMVGSLSGTIQTRGEDKVAMISLGYDMNTGQGTAAVTVGSMGDDTILYFGQDFLTPDEFAELKQQLMGHSEEAIAP